MISMRPRSLALACCLLFAPLAVAAANPEKPASETTPATEDTEAESAETPSAEVATEEKRICRYVKLDASSRRKTKVCRTTEEWRELNNIR
jgi:hypothetical protein